MEDIERLASLEVGTQESHGKENRLRGRLGGGQEHQIIFPGESNKVSVSTSHHILTN